MFQDGVCVGHRSLPHGSNAKLIVWTLYNMNGFYLVTSYIHSKEDVASCNSKQIETLNIIVDVT
jgi:hypothetical protein